MGNDEVAPFTDGFIEDVFGDIKAKQGGSSLHFRVSDLQSCVVIPFLEAQWSELFYNVGYIFYFGHRRSVGMSVLLIFESNCQIEFFELAVVNGRRRLIHNVATGIVFRECDNISDSVESGQY